MAQDTLKAKPFASRKGLEPRLRDDQYISFRVVRSWAIDEKALERDHRKVDPLACYHLIREDLLPFLDSFNISFKACYFSEQDLYYVSARYLFPDEEKRGPEEMSSWLRGRFAAATASGVQGKYDVLNVRIGDEHFAARSFRAPDGTVATGEALLPQIPEACAPMIEWMDRSDPAYAHVSEGFLEEALRQFDAQSEGGRLLRYGMLLGLQVSRERLSGRIGAADDEMLRRRILMDLDLYGSR